MQTVLLDLGVPSAKMLDDLLFALFVFKHPLNEALFEKTLSLWLHDEDGVIIEREVFMQICATDQMGHNIEIEYQQNQTLAVALLNILVNSSSVTNPSLLRSARSTINSISY